MSLLDLISNVANTGKSKCKYCKKDFDKQTRFVQLMESEESDYHVVLELHEYCTNDCANEDHGT